MRTILLGGQSAAAPGPLPEGTCYTTSGAAPTAANLIVYPFAKNSARRRPISTGAVYAAAGHASTVDWQKAPTIRFNVNNNSGHRWTVGANVSGHYHVTVTKNDYPGGGQNIPYTIWVPGEFTGGTVDGGEDQCVTIYDTETGITSQFSQFYRINNTTAHAHARYVITTDARDWRNIGEGRATTSAANISQIGVILRGAEVNPVDGPPIAHAHATSCGGAPKHLYMQLSRDIVWPASGRDGSADNAGNNLGHIPYGALMAVPPQSAGGPNLSALASSHSWTPQQRRWADGLVNFGLYVVDGGPSPCIRGDQFTTTTVRNSLMDVNATLMNSFRMILNNEAGDATVGGGTPLAPNCAFNSTDVAWRVWT